MGHGFLQICIVLIKENSKKKWLLSPRCFVLYSLPMKSAKVVALGGCHVAGYPFEQSDAFPNLVCDLINGELVGQVTNLQFVRLPDHLARFKELQPSHVILQLGNYEFSASFYHVMRQFERAFGLSLSPLSPSCSSSSNSSYQTNSVDALPAKSKIGHYARLTCLGSVTAGIWLFSSKYRHVFRDINCYMSQYPETEFIFLSPLPCLDPTANALRRLGSRLLRRGLVRQPNCHWLDTHQVIDTDQRFFADPSHLSKVGQQTLAQSIAAYIKQFTNEAVLA